MTAPAQAHCADRRTLRKVAPTATRERLQQLLGLCEHKVELFERSIPWPRLAESWREDATLIRQLLEA